MDFGEIPVVSENGGRKARNEWKYQQNQPNESLHSFYLVGTSRTPNKLYIWVTLFLSATAPNFILLVVLIALNPPTISKLKVEAVSC